MNYSGSPTRLYPFASKRRPLWDTADEGRARGVRGVAIPSTRSTAGLATQAPWEHRRDELIRTAIDHALDGGALADYVIELAEPAEREALRRERRTLVIEVEAYKAIATRPRKPTLPQPDDDGGTDGTAA